MNPEKLSFQALKFLKSREEKIDETPTIEDLQIAIQTETDLEKGDEETLEMIQSYHENELIKVDGEIEDPDTEIERIRPVKLRKLQGRTVSGHELPDNPDLVNETDKFIAWMDNLYLKGDTVRGNLYCELKNRDTSPFLKQDVKISSQNIRSLVNEVEDVAGSLGSNTGDKIYQSLLSMKYDAQQAAGQEENQEQGSGNQLRDAENRYSDETVEQAKKLLDERHILKLVKGVLDHKIAGEDLNKLGLFLQLLSKDFDDPLMIFGVQKQGEGKSHVARNVLDLFPPHIVKDVTDMTKAALYRRAEQNPGYFDGKIVFFGEIPENEDERQIFQIFRQLVSEGEVSKELVIEQDGELRPVELRLEGSPAVISTTTNPGLIDEQDLSRGMVYSPEMSKEQNERVRSFQNREKEFPDHVLNPKEVENTEKAIQCALDILSQDNVKLQNPFVRDLDKEVPSDTDNIKRDYPKTVRIASELPAYLYHRQRPKQELNSQEYTFVTWKDVARGVVINRKFINNMIRGRTESAMDAYKQIKENVSCVEYSYDEMRDFEDLTGESFTNKDLEKWMGIAGQTAREYTRRLDKMELIFKDTSVRPHQHYLVEEDVSETAGITLRSLHNIIASVIDQKELAEWARKYIEITGIQGDAEGVLSQIGLSESDLPFELDLGTTSGDTLPNPLYMKISEQKVEHPTVLRVEKKDANIMCRFGSVNQQVIEEIIGESESSPEQDEKEDEEDEQETVRPPKKEPAKTLYNTLKDRDWVAVSQVPHQVPGQDKVEVLETLSSESLFEIKNRGGQRQVRVQ